MIFMEVHTKVGLTCIAKPYADVVWKVWLLGLSPRSVSFSLFSFFLGSPSPLLSQLSFPFILVSPSRSLPTCQFFLVWGSYSSYQSIRQSSWEKLDSTVWVWACQALGSALWCWQLSPLYCFCTEFVLFFMRFCEMLDVRSSSATFLGLQGAFIARPQQQGLSDWALGP